MSLKMLWRLVVWIAALAFAPGAQALCTLVCSCTVTTTPVVFAAYNPLATSNVDSTGVVRVACGGVVGLAIPYSVALSAGSSGSMTNRQMASGARRLAYNLYTTSSYSALWGDGTGGTSTVGGGVLLDVAGLAGPQDLTVYGRIPGGQGTVAPGNYVDTLVVTLTYY